MTPTLPHVIDSTMIACFRQCQQKFFAEFILGLRPPGLSIDLHAGGCFALGLEKVRESVFLRNTSLDEGLAYAHGIFMQEWGDIEPPEGSQSKKAKNKDRVWEAVEYYFKIWPPHSDAVQPLFANGKPTIEFTFAVPLDLPGFPRHPDGDPFIYSGRFDLLGVLDGDITGVDDKSTGRSIGREWAQQWNLRSQFIGYTWAGRQSGLPIKRIIARGIKFQMTDPMPVADAIKMYPDYLIDRWLDQLRRDLTKLVAAWNEGHFEFNLADACTQYGLCIFMDRCTSADPNQWNSIYEVRKWNPLLKNPVAEAA